MTGALYQLTLTEQGRDGSKLGNIEPSHNVNKGVASGTRTVYGSTALKYRNISL